MKKSVTKFTLDFRMPNRPFKLAELKKNKNEDLETPWYVEYHIFSLDENRLVRRRKVLRQNSIEKRIKIGELIISGINKKLLSGAILKNGEEYKEPIEKDSQKEQIQPETEAAPVADPDDITTEAAIIQFIAQKKRTVRKSTMESYNTHVKSKFFRFCEQRGILKEPIKNFTSTMAHEYLDELAMNPEYCFNPSESMDLVGRKPATMNITPKICFNPSESMDLVGRRAAGLWTGLPRLFQSF